MLQSFTQFGVAFLDFFEQPNVLDRDDRLGGKGLNQIYFFFGERTTTGATNVNRTDLQHPREVMVLASAAPNPHDDAERVCAPGNSATDAARSIQKYE